VKAVEVGDYKKCLSNMHDCYFPLAEALKYARGDDVIVKEHSVLESDVRVNTALAESMQSRQTGKNSRSIPLFFLSLNLIRCIIKISAFIAILH
jgi:hypothetical protein